MTAERDFYRRLLELGAAADPEPLLDQALALIVEASGARVAYLELYDLDDDASPRYWRTHGCSEDRLASIRRSISRGIIGRALAEGNTVATPSAVDDPSFRENASVLRHSIQAVLCTPIGRPARGVVYLEGPGASDQFTERNRGAAEMLARQLAMVADRLASSRGRVTMDATHDIRQRFHCEGIVGRSEALARTLREAAQVAPPPISVLLLGPSGSGKSLLARAIAANSARATGPYVDLNCAALPEQLLEGELFGTESGAFTGAVKRIGKVGAARGGTLFLDEVSELAPGGQAKLLQLLQERRYYPLGSNAPVAADIRVISATNKDLKKLVSEQRFREDLYYRLAVMTIVLPGLDQRREDIPDLVERFCAEACERNQFAPLRVTRRALFACRETTWHGDIRGLANAIERAAARANFEGASAIDECHVFPEVPRSDGAPTYREATQRFQRRFLEETLVRHDWNITKAALELDLNRQHLHELISSLGLRRPEAEP